jgi:hypothetical protein
MPKSVFISRAAALCAALHVSSAAMAQAQPAKPYADLHYEGPLNWKGCDGAISYRSNTNDTFMSLQPKGCAESQKLRMFVAQIISPKGGTACYLDEGQVAQVEVVNSNELNTNNPRPQATVPLQNLANVIRSISKGRENNTNTLQSIRDVLPAIEKACFDQSLIS